MRAHVTFKEKPWGKKTKISPLQRNIRRTVCAFLSVKREREREKLFDFVDAFYSCALLLNEDLVYLCRWDKKPAVFVVRLFFC